MFSFIRNGVSFNLCNNVNIIIFLIICRTVNGMTFDFVHGALYILLYKMSPGG